jgi:hypothetical protein
MAAGTGTTAAENVKSSKNDQVSSANSNNLEENQYVCLRMHLRLFYGVFITSRNII